MYLNDFNNLVVLGRLLHYNKSYSKWSCPLENCSSWNGKNPLLVPEPFVPCPHWKFTFFHAGNVFQCFSDMGTNNAEFDANFEPVEKVAKKFMRWNEKVLNEKMCCVQKFSGYNFIGVSIFIFIRRIQNQHRFLHFLTPILTFNFFLISTFSELKSLNPNEQ